MKRSHSAVLRGLSAGLLFVLLLVVSASQAGAATFTELTLQTGWTNAPFATRDASVSLVSGIVHFNGAIAGGTSSVAFTLPSGFRPTTNVYVHVDLCSAANKRLVIQPSGVVSVEAEAGTFASAQCFTSLEGASFTLDNSGFTALTLENGWTNAPFGTSNAGVENIGRIVHLKGAIASGAIAVAFTLPSAASGQRPPSTSPSICAMPPTGAWSSSPVVS